MRTIKDNPALLGRGNIVFPCTAGRGLLRRSLVAAIRDLSRAMMASYRTWIGTRYLRPYASGADTVHVCTPAIRQKASSGTTYWSGSRSMNVTHQHRPARLPTGMTETSGPGTAVVNG